ncbi:MAG: TIM barrel protein, partial [Chloroflexi bacterium]|nr:TIM barrel protein [Chloroflexota bacterium]
MLDAADLCLCCGTIAQASFRELVAAAAAGGFRSISIWPQHYQRARDDGLSDRDMKLMLEDKGLVISELDPLMNWLPVAQPGRAGDAPEDALMKAASLAVDEQFFYHIADTLGGRHLNAVQVFRRRMETEVVASAFAAVCDRAAEHGLMVSLEFLPWSGIPDIKSALGIVRLAGRCNGGVLLDTWPHFRGGRGADDRLKVCG